MRILLLFYCSIEHEYRDRYGLCSAAARFQASINLFINSLINHSHSHSFCRVARSCHEKM